jgi:hypothetical protein
MQLVNAEQKPLPNPFVRFAKALRCPLCGAQLDGNVHPHRASLYCVSYPDEYSCVYSPASDLPQYDTQNIIYGNYKYRIEFNQTYGQLENKIYKIDLNLNVRERENQKKLLFSNAGSKLPIFAKNLTEQQLLHKIKIYNTFS